MEISCALPSSYALNAVSKRSADAYSGPILQKYLVGHTAVPAHEHVYFCVDREIVCFNLNSGRASSLYGHNSPIKFMVADAEHLFSIDSTTIICWDINTHAKVATTHVPNVLCAWVCNGILLIMLARQLLSYQRGDGHLKLLHTIELVSPLSLGVILSGGVMHEQDKWMYVLLSERPPTDQYRRSTQLHVWSTIDAKMTNNNNKPIIPARSKIPLTSEEVFPGFEAYVKQADIQLLSRSILEEYRTTCTHNAFAEHDTPEYKESESNAPPVTPVFDNNSKGKFNAAATILPGSEGREIIELHVLTSNAFLVVYSDALFIYRADWTLLNSAIISPNKILTSCFYSGDNSLIVGLASGDIHIYELASLRVTKTLDFRTYVKTMGCISFVGIVRVENVPCVIVALESGACYTVATLTLSIKYCLSFCSPPSLIVPTRGCVFLASSAPKISLILAQRSFSNRLQGHIINHSIVSTTLSGPVIGLVSDPYYQKYVLVLTESHMTLLTVANSQYLLPNSATELIKTHIKKVCDHRSDAIIGGSFTACPLPSNTVTDIDGANRCEMYLCLLTETDVLVYSVPELNRVGSHPIPIADNHCTYSSISTVLACDRDQQYGDYIVLSGRGVRSVLILETRRETPLLRYHKCYTLNTTALSPVAIHPSSMYAVVLTVKGLILYTLPDLEMISIVHVESMFKGKASIYPSEKSTYTLYFDTIGAYFVLCEVSYERNCSILSIYEFCTGRAVQTVEQHGIIKDVVFVNDINGFMVKTSGYIYLFEYDSPMIDTIAAMSEYLKANNGGSVTAFWASLDDVKWNKDDASDAQLD